MQDDGLQNAYEAAYEGMLDSLERVEKLETALREIASQDVTEIALDPDWPRRIATEALKLP